jgi:sugar phosphate isomerase/epimerase
MTHTLSLHHVTVMEVTPPEVVSIAARLDLSNVCLFTCITPEAASFFPVDWSPAMQRDTASRCADLGVRVHNLEWFDVTRADAADFHRRGLDLGASLGARTATTHVVVDDPAEAGDRFAAFCDLAAGYGIAPAIEFTPLIGTPDLATTLDVIARADRPGGGIALDVLHLFRSGGTVADVRAIAPGIIRSMQISDGPLGTASDLAAYGDETMFQRAIPGEGAFPLTEILALVPPDVIVDVEVPLRANRERGVDAFERARLAVEGARSLNKEFS